MLKINCLLDNTELMDVAMEYIQAVILDSDTKTVKIDKMYQRARKEGLEIDFESFAFAYKAVANVLDPNEQFMTTETQLFDKANKELEDTLASIEADPKLKEIGKNSPEKQILLQVLKLFSSGMKSDVGKSTMRRLQDVVKAKVMSLLDKDVLGTLPPKPTLEDLITKITENQELGIQALDGSFNTIETLVGSVKEEIESIKDSIPDEFLAAFEEFTNNIETGLVNLVLSSSQVQQLIKDSLIRNGFFKMVGDKQVVDWNKVLDGAKVDSVGPDPFTKFSYDYGTLRESIVESLKKAGASQQMAEDLADAIATNLTYTIAEKKAAKLKIPKGTVQKLMMYASIANDQKGLEGSTDILTGNYLMELNKALGFDPDVPTKISQQAVSDMISLYNDLNKVLPQNDPKKLAIQVMTPTFENLIKRRIIQIVNENGLNETTAEMLGSTLEAFVASKGLFLANPYNIVQNITGGLFQAITSGSLADANWGELMANLKSVASGEVENIGKASSSQDEIDYTKSLNALVAYDSQGNALKSNRYGKNIAKHVAKLIKRVSDLLLNSFDAFYSAAVMNNYALTTIRSMAMAKAKKEGMSPEDSLAFVEGIIRAYLGEIRDTATVKQTIEGVAERIEELVNSGMTNPTDIENQIIKEFGTGRVAMNAFQTVMIMRAMGRSPLTERNLASRLFYEVSRGTLVNDFSLTDQASIISRITNDMSLTLLGKKTNSEAFPLLNIAPRATESVLKTIKEKADQDKLRGEHGVPDVIIEYIVKQAMLFASGAARWGVIGMNYTGIDALWHLTKSKDKKALLSMKRSSEEYRKAVEDILEKSKSETEVAREIAAFYKKRQHVVAGVAGAMFSLVTILSMMYFDDDDELTNKIINKDPGIGKQVAKVVQQFPAVYMAAMHKKYGSPGVVRGAYDIMVSRYPSSNEKNRNFIDRLNKATKEATIEKIQDEFKYVTIDMLGDFFTMPFPEFLRTWNDYFAGIGLPIEFSEKRPKPDDPLEAFFNRGIMRPILEAAGVDAFEQSGDQATQLKKAEKYKQKQEKKNK